MLINTIKRCDVQWLHMAWKTRHQQHRINTTQGEHYTQDEQDEGKVKKPFSSVLWHLSHMCGICAPYAMHHNARGAAITHVHMSSNDVQRWLLWVAAKKTVANTWDGIVQRQNKALRCSTALHHAHQALIITEQCMHQAFINIWSRQGGHISYPESSFKPAWSAWKAMCFLHAAIICVCLFASVRIVIHRN